MIVINNVIVVVIRMVLVVGVQVRSPTPIGGGLVRDETVPPLCQRCVPIGPTGSADSDDRESQATFSSSTASTCSLAFTDRDLTVDTLNDHNQAMFELFLTVQETARRGWVSTMHIFISHLNLLQTNMYIAASGAGGGAKPAINVKFFLKFEEGTPSTFFLSSVNPYSPAVQGPQVSCAPSVNKVGAALFPDVCYTV